MKYSTTKLLMLVAIGFGLLCSRVCEAGLFGSIPAALINGYSVDENNDNLYSIDMVTGQTTRIGPVGFLDVEGLSFHPLTGALYGFANEGADSLITINTSTGAGTLVGPSTLPSGQSDVGLAFRNDGALYATTSANSPTYLYSVNPETGAFSDPKPLGRFVSAAAFDGDTLYGVSSQGGGLDPALVTIDLDTGTATVVGTGLGIGDFTSAGLDILPTSILVLLTEGSPGSLYVVDKDTGLATFVANAAPGTFESFAVLVTPEPASVCVWLVVAVICGVGVRHLRRRESMGG